VRRRREYRLSVFPLVTRHTTHLFIHLFLAQKTPAGPRRPIVTAAEEECSRRRSAVGGMSASAAEEERSRRRSAAGGMSAAEEERSRRRTAAGRTSAAEEECSRRRTAAGRTSASAAAATEETCCLLLLLDGAIDAKER